MTKTRIFQNNLKDHTRCILSYAYTSRTTATFPAARLNNDESKCA